MRGREDEERGSELVALALADPAAAVARGRRLIAARPGPVPASFAWQAVGLGSRELGQLQVALRALRRALACAQKAQRPDRVADVKASLGATYLVAGRGERALPLLDEAVAAGTGVEEARHRMRRGTVLHRLDRHEQALADLRACLPVLRAAGDQVWVARTLYNTAAVEMDLASWDAARAHLAEARTLHEELGRELEVAHIEHNLAWLAWRIGDLPAALRAYDQAAQRWQQVAPDRGRIDVDRALALLAAALPADALAAAESGLAAARVTSRYEYVDALLAAAAAAGAAGDAARAAQHARAAERAARATGRDLTVATARLELLSARWALGRHDRRLARAADDVADRLSRARSGESTRAELLAARAWLAVGDTDAAAPHLRRLARARRGGPALEQVTGHVGAALAARARGDSAGVRRVALRGLQVLDEHRLSLGATELRARATAHGQELAALGVHEALRTGRPREVLRWTERWRATVLDLPAARPPEDEALRDNLAALREVSRRVSEHRGDAVAGLERERARLETAVRRATLTRSGGADPLVHHGVDEVLDALDDATLVSLARVDGVLHVLVARRGRVHHVTAGTATELGAEADYVTFALRSGQAGGAKAAAALATMLRPAAARLERALFAGALDRLGDGPLVLVPPARLHALPWAVLPSLRDRAFTVAPSASAWLRARRTPEPPGGKVTLLSGPRLGSEGAEVPALAAAYPDHVRLSDPDATCEAALDALGGAWLAHVAAHGTFRGDNPMFSALELSDGPLTVYDLERLRQAPYRLVLSVCESAVGTAAGVEELLGLSSALIGLGTAGLVASVVPVDDAATVGFSLALHERLRAGDDSASALLGARRAAAGDPLAASTAASFLALGGA